MDTENIILQLKNQMEEQKRLFNQRFEEQAAKETKRLEEQAAKEAQIIKEFQVYKKDCEKQLARVNEDNRRLQEELEREKNAPQVINRDFPQLNTNREEDQTQKTVQRYKENEQVLISRSEESNPDDDHIDGDDDEIRSKDRREYIESTQLLNKIANELKIRSEAIMEKEQIMRMKEKELEKNKYEIEIKQALLSSNTNNKREDKFRKEPNVSIQTAFDSSSTIEHDGQQKYFENTYDDQDTSYARELRWSDKYDNIKKPYWPDINYGHRQQEHQNKAVQFQNHHQNNVKMTAQTRNNANDMNTPQLKDFLPKNQPSNKDISDEDKYQSHSQHHSRGVSPNHYQKYSRRTSPSHYQPQHYRQPKQEMVQTPQEQRIDYIPANQAAPTQVSYQINKTPAISKLRREAAMKNFYHFSGKGEENIDDWFFALNKGFDMTQTGDDERLEIATCFLRDPAKQTYRSLVEKDKNMTYAQFTTAMTRNYQAADIQTKLRRKLDVLKQTRSFQEYDNKFTEIINQVRDMSEVDVITNYNRGLPVHIRARVECDMRRVVNKTLRETRELAALYSAHDSESDQYHEKYAQRPNKQQHATTLPHYKREKVSY